MLGNLKRAYRRRHIRCLITSVISIFSIGALALSTAATFNSDPKFTTSVRGQSVILCVLHVSDHPGGNQVRREGAFRSSKLHVLLWNLRLSTRIHSRPTFCTHTRLARHRFEAVRRKRPAFSLTNSMRSPLTRSLISPAVEWIMQQITKISWRTVVSPEMTASI